MRNEIHAWALKTKSLKHPDWPHFLACRNFTGGALFQVPDTSGFLYAVFRYRKDAARAAKSLAIENYRACPVKVSIVIEEVEG